MSGKINGAMPKGGGKNPRNHCIFPEIMRQSNHLELFLATETIQSGRSHKKWQQNKINKTYLQNSEQFRD